MANKHIIHTQTST